MTSEPRSEALAIEAVDLRKTYPPDGDGARRRRVCPCRPGTIFGLLGPNGAGKVDDREGALPRCRGPTAGAHGWRGSTCSQIPCGSVTRSAWSGQKHGADPEATGRENLVLQGEFYGITGRALKQRVAESLERFGLADAADRAG